MLMPNFMLTVNKPKGSRLDELNLKKLQVSSSLKILVFIREKARPSKLELGSG